MEERLWTRNSGLVKEKRMKETGKIKSVSYKLANMKLVLLICVRVT